MNNNLIEKIEGLQFLTNLKWLGKGYITIILSFLVAIRAITIFNVCSDLSCNKIEKIEGLDNLRELEMLLLAKNRISVIENMESLEKLTLFNIAHNCIERRDNVTIYFFKQILLHIIKPTV